MHAIANHHRNYRGLALAISIAISLLLISTLRAPDPMEWLHPIVALLKIIIRLSLLFGFSFLLLIRFRKNFPVRNAYWFVPLVLLLMWGSCSTLWSARPNESVGQVMSLTTLVLLSFSISLIVRSELDLEKLMRWTISNMMTICIFLLAVGVLIPSSSYLTRDGMGLGHSTNSGATASLGLVMLILSVILWKWKWAKAIAMPGCIIFLAVSILSANRLSMGISAVIVPCVIVCFGGRRWIGWSIVGIAILGTLYPIIDPKFELVGTAIEAVNRGQSSDEISSFSGRQVMWEAMWNSFLDSPWIGHGYFMSSASGGLEVWYLNGEMEPVNWTAHNVWLQAMVSTGVIGLVLLLLAFGLPLATMVCRWLAGHPWTKIDSWFASLVIWYFIWGMLNESILGPLQPESVIFFIMYGILIARLTGRFDIKTNSDHTVLDRHRSTGIQRNESVGCI